MKRCDQNFLFFFFCTLHAGPTTTVVKTAWVGPMMAGSPQKNKQVVRWLWLLYFTIKSSRKKWWIMLRRSVKFAQLGSWIRHPFRSECVLAWSTFKLFYHPDSGSLFQLFNISILIDETTSMTYIYYAKDVFFFFFLKKSDRYNWKTAKPRYCSSSCSCINTTLMAEIATLASGLLVITVRITRNFKFLLLVRCRFGKCAMPVKGWDLDEIWIRAYFLIRTRETHERFGFCNTPVT